MFLKERFSIDAKVGFDFSKTIDRSLKMESDYRLQQEIHTIVEHADIVEKEQKEEKKARKKARKRLDGVGGWRYNPSPKGKPREKKSHTKGAGCWCSAPRQHKGGNENVKESKW